MKTAYKVITQNIVKVDLLWQVDLTVLEPHTNFLFRMALGKIRVIDSEHFAL